MSHNIFRNRRDLGQIISTDKLLATEYRRYVPIVDNFIITITTNKQGVFLLTFSTNSGVLSTTFPNGDVQLTNTPTFTFPDNTTKNVKVYAGTSSADSIVIFFANNTAIIGTLNLSKLIKCVYYDFRNCTQLTSIIFPKCDDAIVYIYLGNCNISELDFSPLTAFGGNIQVYNNYNLTNLILPNITRSFTYIDFQRGALNQVSIDNLFSKLNIWYSANPPTANLTINVSLGTNASPTGGVNNTDILSLQSIFSLAGRVLTISIN